jgi:predicted nucleic acid-binding protein
MTPAPRVVLDTHVVLSALLFSQGRLARLRLASRQASFHPLVSLPFLQLAAAGSADCLVTGDRDLLGLNGEMKCPIITAAEFLLSLNRSRAKP